MLAQVTIQNFQSHKKTLLDFVPGTNVIIGESDAGKSAIFRAINWVLTNRPLGDSYRSEWGGETKVVLHTTDGHIIERVRSDGVNMYVLDGVELKAFGTEVPADVVDVLQIDAVNIQAQMDPPFLLACSPGEAAQQLNKAASIDDIDRSIGWLKKEHAADLRLVKHKESALEEHMHQMAKFDDLDELQALVEQAEKVERVLQGRKGQAELLEQQASRLRSTESALQTLPPLEEISTLCAAAEAAHAQHTEQKSHLTSVSIAIHRLQEIDAELKSTQEIDKAITVVNEAEKIAQHRGEREQRAAHLFALVGRGKLLEHKIESVAARIACIEEEYQAICPDECPLCGKEMG